MKLQFLELENIVTYLKEIKLTPLNFIYKCDYVFKNSDVFIIDQSQALLQDNGEFKNLWLKIPHRIYL